MTHSLSPRRRSGFTLIELLVVMGLMVILAAMAVGVAYSGAVGSQKVTSGADRVSGWLLVAKNSAKRDNAPRGVRFYINANTNPLPELRGMVTEAQYIEQPDVWVPNRDNSPTGPRLVFVQTVNPATNQVASREVHFIGTAAELSEFNQRVEKGDQLVIPQFNGSFQISQKPTLSNVSLMTSSSPTYTYSNRVSYRIMLNSIDPTAVATYNPAYPNELDLGAMNSTPPAAPAAQPTYVLGAAVTAVFSIRPAPRPLLGEDTLQLTGGTVIDYRPPSTSPAPFPNGTLTTAGYRDWSNPPTPPAAPVLNTAPFHPSTTIGVGTQTDASGNAFFDVLFTPSGSVMYAPSGLICLWVRDSSKLVSLGNHPRVDPTNSNNIDTLAQFDEAGQQFLVVIYTKTGMNAVQPVAQPPASPTWGYDPYRFAKDGINAGL